MEITDKKSSDKSIEQKDKPSNAWYLLSIVLGIFGGIIGYYSIRNKDRKMANNLLYVGFVVSAISVFMNSL